MGRSSAQEASRLFRERGVEAVSISDVMAAASMTPGGFYKHFASKEALVEEACTLSFDQAARVWRKLIQRDVGTEGAAVIVDHYFRARPAHFNCPMLAYAPHMSDNNSPRARQIYSDGASALLSDFPPRCGSRKDDEAKQETQILFAAMIGAQLLAQASDHADWATSLQQTVARWAAKTT